MTPRLVLALLLPFVACGLQWLLWDPYLKPLVWFLFFPAAFFSAWLGGVFGGLASAVIGALLVWYVFMPPAFSFGLDNPANLFSIGVFIFMGGLYVWLFERLRRARQRSDTRFEATFEQAAVGIALVAPDGRWLRVNRKLCAIVGYTPEELLARTFQDITHPDDLDADLGQVRRMLAREIDTYSMEKRYFHKDGHIVWINLTVSLIWKPEGSPDYFISVIKDISARKAAEAALRASEERLRLAQESAGVGIWDWRIDSGALSWTAELERLYGYAAGTFPGTYAAFSARVHPDDLARIEQLRDEAVNARRDFDFDFRIQPTPDSTRWVNCKGAAIYDEAGKTQRVFGVNFDITERKQAEAELKARNEELERYNQAAEGRELRMIELKREVNGLARELGRAPPYELAFADAHGTGQGS